MNGVIANIETEGIVMRIIRVDDYGQLSERAAWFIAARIILKPDCVLGLATGTTPEGTYKSLFHTMKRESLIFLP